MFCWFKDGFKCFMNKDSRIRVSLGKVAVFRILKLSVEMGSCLCCSTWVRMEEVDLISDNSCVLKYLCVRRFYTLGYALFRQCTDTYTSGKYIDKLCLILII